MIPDIWQYLEDEEIITKDCVCFGELSNGKIGWGQTPSHLVGEAYCIGWEGHPDLIAKKVNLKRKINYEPFTKRYRPSPFRTPLARPPSETSNRKGESSLGSRELGKWKIQN